jgi:hypothetical protein
LRKTERDENFIQEWKIKFGETLLRFCSESLELPSYSKNLKTKIFRTIILPFVLYRCETWSLTLREEHIDWVCMRRGWEEGIFGHKKEAKGWRRLHNEELRNLYCSPNIIKVIKSRRMRGAGHVARMGEFRSAYSI